MENKKCSNKVDLTLKLSPSFGDEKKKKLKEESMAFLPCLNKPSSEAEDGNGNGEKRKRYRVTVNGAKFFQVKGLLDPSSVNSNLHQQGDSSARSHLVIDGLNLNNNASTMKQNDSMVSKKTTNLEGLNYFGINGSTAKQNDSLASKKTTNEKAEGLVFNTNASTVKESDTLAPKKTTNSDEKVEGLDLNTNVASAMKQNDSLTPKKPTIEKAEGLDLNTNAEGLDLNANASMAKQNASLASKKTTAEGLDLNANASLASKKRINGNAAKGLDLNTNAPAGEEQNDAVLSKKTRNKDACKRFKLENYCSLKGDVMEILRRMPNVTTVGDGPNGRRVEGFLYKYRSNQVCIVCVCHGNFLTPAEFVMHAGGVEVEDPMKKITVYFGPF